MIRPIHISLSPNLGADDVMLAFRTMLSGPRAKSTDVEHVFTTFLDHPYRALTFNSGRAALWAILKALGIGTGDEVAIQAFTCIVVPNAIRAAGARPLYIDITNDTYNLDQKDLARKITPHTKAVIVQHTFGHAAEVNAITALCKKHNCYLIEDCAHALGATYEGKKVGTFGDVSFFSLGRDKVVSSVFGGIGAAKEKEIFARLAAIQKNLPSPPVFWTIQQLLHPILTWPLLFLYNYANLGKAGLAFAQQAGILSKAVYPSERKGTTRDFRPTQYPDALAPLALHQLDKLSQFNEHRRMCANLYFEILAQNSLVLPPKNPESIYLRFAIRTPKASLLLHKAKGRGWVLGDWYRHVVMPCDDFRNSGYTEGACPVAEQIATEVINLPTYPTLSLAQAREVAMAVSQWMQEK